MDSLTPLTKARSIVKKTVEPCGSTVKPLDETLGHVLYENVVASECFPAFRTSAMDGYAIRQGDLKQTKKFEQIGTISAGDEPDTQLNSEECVGIMTGAPVPADADAVIPVEDTSKENGHVLIQSDLNLKPGTNIRNPGEDIVVGDTVVESGTTIRPYEIGGALLAGRSTLSVVDSPSTVCLITGDELVSDPDDSLSTGEIRDTNRITLKQLLETDGACFEEAVSVPDNPDVTRREFEKAVNHHDLVISTGGISHGDRDYVKESLLDLDANVHFHGVAVKPGKPVAFAELNNTYIFALPGNVVSTLVNYELFVRPALLKMRGLGFRDRSRFNAISNQDWPRDPNRHVYYRVSVDERPYPKAPLVERSRVRQGSHMITTFTEADGLLEVPPETSIKEGDPVEVLDLRENSFTAV